MNCYKMLDSAYAPTPENISLAKSEGVAVWGGYVGGGSQLNAWTEAEVKSLIDGGIRFLPFYVWDYAYSNTAAQVSHALSSASLYDLSHVCIDFEHAIPADFSPTAGVMLYADSSNISDRIFSCPVICANFDGIPSLTVSYLGKSRVFNGHQYQGTSDFHGMSVDYSVVDDVIISLGGGSTPAPVPATQVVDYTVVSGDTLSEIVDNVDTTDHLGITTQEAYQENVSVIGSDINLIRPGEHLVLHEEAPAPTPVSVPTPVAAPLVIHYTVVSGDTLSGIAEKLNGVYHVSLTWQEIYNQNRNWIGGNPNLIHPGQRYTIKC